MPAHDPSDVRALVAAYINVWNTGHTGELEGLVTEDYARVADSLSESAEGRAALERLIEKTRLDMPDFHSVAEDIVVEGDRAAVRWRMTGIDTGPGDFRPTGRALRVDGLSLFEARGGRLTREWTILDGLAALGQLGFSMQPAAAP